MSFSAFDHECMAEALRLARRGLDTTHPNPRVGCVLARDGAILASGWHARAGGPHAEAMALTEAGQHARGANAYVTLEPCSHQGRTGPCAGALIEAGVSGVVMAMLDPHPEVNGRGRSALEAAGIRCRSGLMAAQAEALNRGFLSRIRRGRPWVRVKLAQSLDGRTALENGDSQWISGEAARRDVQHWRARSSAVMTGVGTVLADDPSLDVRLEGAERQPLRVIVDSHWRTPPSARTLALPGDVLIAGLAGAKPPAELASSGARLCALPERCGRVDLAALMQALAEEHVNEVQVEAGERLAGALLEARLVDEVLLYQSPCLLGVGARSNFAVQPLARMADRMEFNWLEARRLGSDLRLRLAPQYPVH